GPSRRARHRRELRRRAGGALGRGRGLDVPLRSAALNSRSPFRFTIPYSSEATRSLRRMKGDNIARRQVMERPSTIARQLVRSETADELVAILTASIKTAKQHFAHCQRIGNREPEPRTRILR